MLSAIRRRREEEDGFTLIELMVVILIIAILMAIAIPTYLGARNRADDRAAQSDLRNALTAEETVYSNGSQTFSSSTTELSSAEANLTWETGSAASASSNQVSVSTSTDGSIVCLASQAADGNWYAIYNNAGNGTTNAVTLYFNGGASGATNSNPCSAAVSGTSAPSGSGWGNTF